MTREERCRPVALRKTVVVAKAALPPDFRHATADPATRSQTLLSRKDASRAPITGPAPPPSRTHTSLSSRLLCQRRTPPLPSKLSWASGYVPPAARRRAHPARRQIALWPAPLHMRRRRPRRCHRRRRPHTAPPRRPRRRRAARRVADSSARAPPPRARRAPRRQAPSRQRHMHCGFFTGHRRQVRTGHRHADRYCGFFTGHRRRVRPRHRHADRGLWIFYRPPTASTHWSPSQRSDISAVAAGPHGLKTRHEPRQHAVPLPPRCPDVSSK